MGAGVQCIKYTLFVFNLLIALCGLGLVVIGCLFIFGLQDDVVEWIDIDTVAAILDNELLRSAVYIVIGAGGLVFLIAVCGCLGAILSSKCLLALYFVFLMIIFAAQLAAGIIAAIYGGEVADHLATEGKEFLQTGYDQDATGVNKTVTEAWDQFQETFKCCGVDDKDDYVYGVPDSCCEQVEGYTEGTCGTVATAYVPGCQATLEDLVEEYETILAAAAVGVACFELFCMLFAICLCRNIDDEDD
ncbi:tetraspanin-18B-like [Amphiura filiformis]|uniref:tetraspanin-18B-like n=1 Tax=Amphiura filiformis TaxID=82378 RepID=UPI003B215270